MDLDGPVEIDEGRPRQDAPPPVEVLGGEHFAGKKNSLQRSKLELVEQVLVRNVHQDRRHPENEADSFFFQQLDEPGGENGGLVGNDDHRGAPGQAEIELENVDVEVERGQAADTLPAIE